MYKWRATKYKIFLEILSKSQPIFILGWLFYILRHNALVHSFSLVSSAHNPSSLGVYKV